MLSDRQKQFLDSLDIIDVIDHYTVEILLQYIDPLHAIVVYGIEETLNALERYENNSDR